jgi:serine/threonine-protein kinase
MTQEGATLGTPFYMPPEQIRGDKHIDARADIYALGVILYECVGGNRPFNADTLAHLAVLIHEGNPLPITELRPELPARFADIVHRAMAKDKEQRPATARELAESLASFTPQVLGPTVGWAGPAAPPLEPARVKEQPKEKLLASASYGSGVAIPESKIPRRSLAPMILIGAGVVAIGLVLFLVTRPSVRKPIEGETSVGAPATVATGVAASPALPTAATAAPSVAEQVPTVAPSASADPKAALSKTPPGHPSSNVSPVRPDETQKNQKSRVDQRGLAKDNPFK